MRAPASPKPLIYKSAGIHERRKRILREARLMISEFGYERFNIRELAVRAEVAPKTLYNAFTSKEVLIATSIIEYAREFSDNLNMVNGDLTLKGKLERAIRIHSRNLQIRPYTAAIMTLYNSPMADPTIRQAIRDLSIDGHSQWADYLKRSRGLRKEVEPLTFARQIASFTYCTLTEWCAGEVADDRLIDSIAESILVVVIGSTRGAIRREAEMWLNAVRTGGPAWLDLRAQAPNRRSRTDPVSKSGAAAVG
jgi:AcrR family transcriptional regulator